MIRLPYTGTYSLELVTAQNGAEVVVCYSDATATAYTGGTQATTITSATTTTIGSTPAAATVRDVDEINIKNTYAGSHTVTVQLDVNATNYPIITAALLQNESLNYTHGSGWQAKDANGNTKSSALTSMTSAQLAAIISDETGTGAAVFANSPTLVTPALGTPGSGDLRNCSLAVAPAIGGTTPAAGAFTTLSATDVTPTGSIVNQAYAKTNTAAAAVQYFFTQTATVNGAYTTSGADFRVRCAIASGVTNSGDVRGFSAIALRNYVVAGDVGTMSGNLLGATYSYGHFNTDASAPVSNVVSGIYLVPYRASGTISTMYDIYIAAETGTSTVTTRWGIYQVDANNNALKGKTRFGGVTAPVETVDVTGSIAATTTILSRGATSGIGYTTGAGGAVTQATNRTTGVTLSKVSGAITLVSAAGTTAWQSFTVTNTAVAATDTVIVNQKSGTDKYMIHVTAVAAGSFEITFATTGGTTTEQPVFNFNVIKGVAA